MFDIHSTMPHHNAMNFLFIEGGCLWIICHRNVLDPNKLIKYTKIRLLHAFQLGIKLIKPMLLANNPSSTNTSLVPKTE